MKRIGALPYQTIREMIETGSIEHGDPKHIQPASLDLTLTDAIYRIDSAFLPRPGEPIKDAMHLASPEEYDIRAPLEVDIAYLARLNERLTLERDIYAYANPKSSTGRNDLHVRMLADGITRFDSAGVRGFCGDLWALITPCSYRVRINPGDSLLQMRFFNQDTRLDTDDELERTYKKHTLLFGPDGSPIRYEDLAMNDRDGSLVLTLNLDLPLVGYRAERSNKVVDFSKRDFYDPADFFTPILRPKDGAITLRRGDFYILVSRESFLVPEDFAAEMEAIDVRAGDYRAHYAGYFDPGWGHGPEGTRRGAPAVLEVRAFKDNIIVRHGQPFCKMRLERMAGTPELVYGATGSNYFDQRGPRLAKQFKKNLQPS